MEHVTNQLDDLAAALRQQPTGDVYYQMHAAQQALSWALEPTVFGDPLTVIRRYAAADECRSVAKSEVT